MSTRTNMIIEEDIRLQYEVYGEGETVILCFHGNDRSAKDFEFLKQKDRKIISISLFFHGKSTFSISRIDENLITVEHMGRLISKILKKEEVALFHLLAYSQGGRFALCLFPTFSQRIASFYLLAPDGLNNHNFYSWSQQQRWARKLFQRWLKRPQELMNITRFFVNCRIIKPKMIDFMGHYSSDKERFLRAYRTWAGFRNLRPSPLLIQNTFKNHPIPFQLIIGEYDQIITVKSAQKFLKKINRPNALKVIPFGHDIFKPPIEKELKKILKF